jgi:hypothetical protein
MSACSWNLWQILTIVGEDAPDEPRPCDQSQAHCGHDQTDENDIRCSHIVDFGGRIAEVKLADVDANTPKFYKLSSHDDTAG